MAKRVLLEYPLFSFLPSLSKCLLDDPAVFPGKGTDPWASLALLRSPLFPRPWEYSLIAFLVFGVSVYAHT